MFFGISSLSCSNFNALSPAPDCIIIKQECFLYRIDHSGQVPQRLERKWTKKKEIENTKNSFSQSLSGRPKAEEVLRTVEQSIDLLPLEQTEVKALLHMKLVQTEVTKAKGKRLSKGKGEKPSCWKSPAL